MSDVFKTPKASTYRNSCSVSKKVKELLNIKISALHVVPTTTNSKSHKKLYKSTSDQLPKNEQKDQLKLKT